MQQKSRRNGKENSTGQYGVGDRSGRQGPWHFDMYPSTFLYTFVHRQVVHIYLSISGPRRQGYSDMRLIFEIS
jgi:hypothetical protein